MVLAFSAFGEIEDRAGAASMDECPAMKRCWDSAMKLQRASKTGHLGRECALVKDQCESIEMPRKVIQVLEFRRRRLTNMINSFVQDFSKAHHLEQQLNFFRNASKPQSVLSPSGNPLHSLSVATQSFWAKTISRIKQQDTGPLLASATTTALSQLPSIAPSLCSNSYSDELQSESSIKDPYFDAFLDGRDLEAFRQRNERPSWVAEPSDSTLLVAEEIAVRAVEGWSGFIRPVDKIWEVSSGFGPRWGRQHNGVDLAAPTGEPVLAADSGEVTYAGWEPGGYGYLVEITHRDGWKTLYAHNSEIFTWEGQLVRRGDCIATVGETGRATGPHLHWEIRNHQNKPVDPSDHMKL
ncbi:hypothetical protein MPTK1_2g03310 [Marchantia polymorpha subsp. ruderalis]|uniref:M23ase beta-sheet core domain-containing protein n=1 Tax=Marchantia polymorpha TaxID=3197 RepID=A0A2R6W072_MARPO|nr:hypothetical protein MARPO_0211s0016 [Marchantia polymorpha]BBN00948.1 hypothetical protein Mp_2g03310 [Marchantia polymorpha subsp. ruderalis]|eukprot:PTQ27256.1 hypothetical protein MARPO_0211s0016 [Marchantia polymorpha]